MPNMKFRVEGVTHSVLIQRALFRMGYGWDYGERLVIDYETMPYLYAVEEGGCKNLLYSNSDDAFFDGYNAAEYVYRLGMVEPRDGRPVQDVPPPLLDADDPAEMHAHMPDPKPYKAADTLNIDGVDVPLGAIQPDLITAGTIQLTADNLVDGNDLPGAMHINARGFKLTSLNTGETIVVSTPPPIGIKPRLEADRMHHRGRWLELAGAINRYTNAQLIVPVEWLTEYNERVEEIRKLEKTA